jgi:N-acetyl-1-D-myo-inositol-2-amino-2-deoxy-alpha-D-glucopyranoside deacetylase
MAETSLRVMMVHAHPDDEAVSTGGTLARYSAQGARTILVTCTRGEEGEIVVPELKAEIADSAPSVEEGQERLALVREKELAAAVAALGISQFYSLGYRDSGMAGTDANANPRAFTNVPIPDSVAKLVEIVRRERPHVLVSYKSYGGYGHPDHIMAYRITALAFDAAANTEVYPQQSDATPPWQPLKLYETANSRDHMIAMAAAAKERGLEMTWGAQAAKQTAAILRGEPVDPENPQRPPWGLPEDAITTFIDIRQYLQEKLASLLAHRTQAVSADRFMGAFPEDFVQQAFGTEYYVLARSRVATTRPETDLFASITAD